jgi:uncharacterized spore protein YtfJ
MDDRMAESAARVQGQVDEMIRRMNAKAVFGEPIQQGSLTLIPVASVTYGFGSGQGYGRGTPKQGKEGAPEAGQEGDQGEGAGAGGGAGGMARPLGYIKIDENGAKWEPTMNMTLVSLGGMLMVAWNVFWVMKMIRETTAAKRSGGCC